MSTGTTFAPTGVITQKNNLPDHETNFYHGEGNTVIGKSGRPETAGDLARALRQAEEEAASKEGN